MQCSRFYTDLNFKKRVIINSCSLRNIKWGEKNDNLGRKSVVECKINPNVFNTNIKRLNTSKSTKNQNVKEENKINKEEEKKREEEIKRKREMSYRARKRIILRMRGAQDETEEQNKIAEEKEDQNKIQKIRKIEIKYSSNNSKFKRVNSNNIINYNNQNFNNNDINFFEKKNNTNINTNNINESNNIVDDINNNNNLNKEVKNNFIFYRNIRNIYKKNIIKDISVLNEKNCKILKVEKKCKENQNKTYNDEKISKRFNKNGTNINKKNTTIINKDKKEKTDKDDNKNECNNTNITNNNYKNNHAMLKYLENQRNKKNMYNPQSQLNNDINLNDIYYSFNSTNKYLTRINSAHLENLKQKEENIQNLKEINNDVNNNNKKKVNRMRLDNNEKRNIYDFSFINKYQSKRNKINQSDINLESVNDKIPDNKTFKLDNHSLKSLKKERASSNLNMINLRILSNNYLNGNKFNSIEPDYLESYKNTDFLDKKIYINHFFEELIDICNSLNNRSLLGTLLNNFNQKYYIINVNCNEFLIELFKENDNFEYIFKHFGLVLISLIFLSKDEVLYNNCFLNVKELLIKLIYSSLNYVEIYGNKESNKIYNFINNNNFQNIIPNHRYILNLIYLLFDNKKEYLPLKEALEQLHNTIIKKDFLFLIKIINDCILFCYNSKPKSSFFFPFFAFKNNILVNQQQNVNNANISNNTSSNNTPNINNNVSNNTTPNNNNLNNIEKVPTTPFIKSSMKKKFCLVLDIDETISHTLKLSFGGYFLLRPGAKDFLEEISKYYEIIIFTSSPKKYADKILNKIDIDGNLITHRLYKTHVVFENGKTVKNLNMIGRDLTKTIFVDNLRSNAKYNLNNLCPITTWISDIFDNRLIKLKDKLIYIATCGKYDNDITQGL